MDISRREVMGGIAGLFTKPDIFRRLLNLFPAGSALRTLSAQQIEPLFELIDTLAFHNNYYVSAQEEAFFLTHFCQLSSDAITNRWITGIQELALTDERIKTLHRLDQSGIDLRWLKELMGNQALQQHMADIIDMKGTIPTTETHFYRDGVKIDERISSAGDQLLLHLNMLQDKLYLTPELLEQSSLSDIAKLLERQVMQYLGRLPAPAQALTESDAHYLEHYAQESERVRGLLEHPPESLRKNIEKLRQQAPMSELHAETRATGQFVEPAHIDSTVRSNGLLEASLRHTFTARALRPTSITQAPRALQSIGRLPDRPSDHAALTGQDDAQMRWGR